MIPRSAGPNIRWASLATTTVCLLACSKEAPTSVKPPKEASSVDLSVSGTSVEAPVAPVPSSTLDPTASALPPGFRSVSGAGYRGYLRTDLPGDSWTPSDEVLAELERKLLPAFDEAMKSGKLTEAGENFLKRLPSYVRVYHPYKIGVIDVALYCGSAEKKALDPAGGPDHIKGGGDCYAHARYVDDKGGYFTILRTNARR